MEQAIEEPQRPLHETEAEAYQYLRTHVIPQMHAMVAMVKMLRLGQRDQNGFFQGDKYGGTMAIDELIHTRIEKRIDDRWKHLFPFLHTHLQARAFVASYAARLLHMPRHKLEEILGWPELEECFDMH